MWERKDVRKERWEKGEWGRKPKQCFTKHGKQSCAKKEGWKKAKSWREDFCAEEAYVKVLRAQRWVKSQNVKFRQGNNYRQRQKDYFANRDMEKEWERMFSQGFVSATVVKHNGQFYNFSITGLQRRSTTSTTIKQGEDEEIKMLKAKRVRNEDAQMSMRQMKWTMVECLKSKQGEITTSFREGVTNISFEA